ncbi:hypothetical protein thsps21_39760 [Pseudomonas sp. No.21]|nr:hypothetical protein TUM20249_36020 [Pseudomonas tohonis]
MKEGGVARRAVYAGRRVMPAFQGDGMEAVRPTEVNPRRPGRGHEARKKRLRKAAGEMPTRWLNRRRKELLSS